MSVMQVTSQLLLLWPMDQMCSKCKIHCFSHELWTISKLQKISEKKIFLSEFVFFKEFFFDKNVSSDNIFSNNFSLLSRPLHCIKVICIETAYFT